MLYDRINLLQGADIQNLVVASGVSFPSSPDLGELFFRTDQDKLYVYKSGGWAESGAAFDSSANQTVSGTWTFTQPVVGATPTASNQLTTKSYVDAATDTSANKSITGSWSFSQPVAGATPTGPTHLATKSYVDTAVANAGSGSVSSVNVSGGTTGLTTSGGPITSSGTITLGGVLALANGGTGGSTQASALNNLLPSQGAAAGKVLSSDGTNAVWDAVPAKGDTVGQIQIRDNNGYMTNSLSTMDSSGMTLHSGTSTSTYTAEAGNNVRLLGLDVEVGLVAAGTTGVAKIQSPTDIKFVAGNIERLNINSSGAFGFQNVYGTAGQVLTSQGTGAVPTWTTVSSAASALTGTTLASNVVTSSLTAVGTITTGTWSGSFGAVSGANLTNLNASNLASGTVGTARLGSGTANNTTYLRGDGTWATVTAGSVSSLQGTGAYGLASTTGAYVGTASDSGTTIPIMAFAQSDAAADAKYWRVTARNGIFRIGGINDALSTFNEYLTITRNGAVASLITQTATGINLAVGTAGLQLNGSAGTSGQVLTSQGASAAPIWSSPSVTALNATGTIPTNISSTSVTAGSNPGGNPMIQLVHTTPAAGNKAHDWRVNSSGVLQFNLMDDALTGISPWMSVTRSANTATLITQTANSINLAGLSTGLQLNGSVGTAGQVLTSNGAAAPTWQAAVAAAGTLTGTTLASGVVSSSLTSVGTLTSLTTSGVINNTSGGIKTTGAFSYNTASTIGIIGVNGSSEPGLYLVNASPASTDSRTFRTVVDSSGSLLIGPVNNSGVSSNAIAIARNGNTVNSITLAGTAITLTGAVSGTSFSGPLTGSLIASSNQAISAATTAPIIGVLTGGGASFNGRATMALVSSSASAGSRVWGRQVDGSGNLYEYLWDDTQATGTAWLQVVRSGNTATSITLTGTSLVMTGRVDFGKAYTELSNTATATASTTIDCSLGNIFTVTMSASITTLAFSNVPASGRAYNMTLVLKQDATGGRSITWPAAVKWAGSVAPSLSLANKTDIVNLFTTDNGTTWYGTVVGQNF